MNNKKNNTVAKGYRLKPETHKMVKQIQKKLKCNQETVISQALKYFNSQIDIKTNNNQ